MSGPQLAREIIQRWFNRRRPEPPRAVRIVLKADGQTVIDISSRLALAMIDCEYGNPLRFEHRLAAPPDAPPHVVTLSLSEVDP